MGYILHVYKNIDEFYKESYMQVASFHWEAPEKFRPKVFCKLGVVGDSLISLLKAYESEPKAVYSNINDPVYKDSCLEFFCKPITFRDEYINVECNSKGVYLCEVGKSKTDRKYVNTITDMEPTVKPFKGKDSKGDFWGVEIQLTKDFLSAVYKIKKNELDFDVVKANFYKCGDDCKIPHYVAFSPVTTLPPGFHNPECFAVFNKECK